MIEWLDGTVKGVDGAWLFNNNFLFVWWDLQLAQHGIHYVLFYYLHKVLDSITGGI